MQMLASTQSYRIWKEFGFAHFSACSMEAEILWAQREWTQLMEVVEDFERLELHEDAREFRAYAGQWYGWGEFFSWYLTDLQTDAARSANYSTIPLASRLQGKSLLSKFNREQKKLAKIAALQKGDSDELDEPVPATRTP